jgi:F-type H+-transporting ATPase subunit b
MVQIAPDWTLFVQIANFLFLLAALNVILYRPIRKILSERKEKITGLESSVEDLNRYAEEKREEFANKINEAKLDGFQKKEALKAEGAEEEKHIISEIHQKAQTEMESVRSQIAKDVESVRNTLQKEIKNFSAAIVDKILGRAVS